PAGTPPAPTAKLAPRPLPLCGMPARAARGYLNHRKKGFGERGTLHRATAQATRSAGRWQACPRNRKWRRERPWPGRPDIVTGTGSWAEVTSAAVVEGP